MPDFVRVGFGAPRPFCFAGCLVKSREARILSFAGDADLKRRPHAIELINERYPSATTVVPGQAKIGGRELLGPTSKLLARAVSTQPVVSELLH
jgi:hypothetical protein